MLHIILTILLKCQGVCFFKISTVFSLSRGKGLCVDLQAIQQDWQVTNDILAIPVRGKLQILHHLTYWWDTHTHTHTHTVGEHGSHSYVMRSAHVFPWRVLWRVFVIVDLSLRNPIVGYEIHEHRHRYLNIVISMHEQYKKMLAAFIFYMHMNTCISMGRLKITQKPTFYSKKQIKLNQRMHQIRG